MVRMTTAHVLAASQISAGGRVGIVAIGVVFLALGLYLAIRPKRVATPPRWQYRGPDSPEPRPITVDIVRIGGIVWAAIGVAFVVIAVVA